MSSAIDCRRSASARMAIAWPRRPSQSGVAVGRVPRAEARRVAGERVAPAHGRIVAGGGQVAVERPVGPHEAPRVGGHGLGLVASGRGDRGDDRHRCLAPAERAESPGTLVEGRQLGRELGRVALLDGQGAGPRRRLAQGLGPARGGVGDDHRVEAHVAVELGHGDARVDAQLACHDRHVRRVGDDHGALEQRPVGARVDELAKLAQGVRHLVAALAAPDVHDDVRVAPLGDLLEEDRLAGAEAAGHRCGAPSREREEEVEDALAGGQRRLQVQALGERSRTSHGPQARQPDVHVRHLRDDRVGRVEAGRSEVPKLAGDPGRHLDRLVDREALAHPSEDRAARDERCRRVRRAGTPLRLRAAATPVKAPGPRKSGAAASGRSSPSKTPPISPGPRRTDSGRRLLVARSPTRRPPVYSYTWAVMIEPRIPVTSPGSLRGPTSTRSASETPARPSISTIGPLTRTTVPSTVAGGSTRPGSSAGAVAAAATRAPSASFSATAPRSPLRVRAGSAPRARAASSRRAVPRPRRRRRRRPGRARSTAPSPSCSRDRCSSRSRRAGYVASDRQPERSRTDPRAKVLVRLAPRLEDDSVRPALARGPWRSPSRDRPAPRPSRVLRR